MGTGPSPAISTTGCFFDPLGATVASLISEAERERTQAAAAQAKYEASGQRQAKQICEAWSVETLMQQQIDRDKEAEAISGVVNLATRHKAAKTIVFMRGRRETATAAYRKKTGKSFNLAQCRK